MRKIMKKRSGFTLIEMVAVVAIIGILAAILVPKITGYMKEAKKTEVVDQARKVLQAYETAKMKGKQGTETEANFTMEDLKANATTASLLDHPTAALKDTLKKLPAATSVKDCRDIVENSKEFTVNDKGVLQKIEEGKPITQTPIS